MADAAPAPVPAAPAPAASAPAAAPTTAPAPAANDTPAAAPGSAPAGAANDTPPAETKPAEGAPKPEGEPKAEEKPPETTEPPTAVETESEKITRWTARQRAFAEAQEKHKSEVTAFEAKAKENAGALDLAKRIEAAKGKPHEVAKLLGEVLGTSYEDLTKAQLEATAPDPKVLELEKRVAETQKALEDQQKREVAARAQATVAAQHTEIAKLLETGGDKYELTRLNESPETIFEMADQIVRVNPKKMPRDAEGARKLYAEVADALEKQHEGRLEKSLNTGKAKARLAPKPPPAPAPGAKPPAASPAKAPEAPTTLTNAMQTQRTEQVKKPETSDQKLERIIREFKEKNPDKKV